jgi:hypothetical protein
MVYDQQSKSSSWTPTPRKSSFFPPAHIQTKTEAKKGSELVGNLPSKAQRDKIRRSLFGDIPEMTGAKAETAPTEAKEVENPTQVSEEAASGEIQAKAETGLSQSQGYGVPSREVRKKIRRRLFGNLEPTPVQKQGEGSMDDAGGEEKGLAETEISLPIQAKLTIGEPNDKYEQEADRVARQVVDKIHSPTPETVQRQEMGDEDEVRLKSDAGSGGKQEAGVGVTGVRKSPIQRLTINRAVNSEGETQEASAQLEASIQGKRGSGQPLDESVREPMEGAFGADFSGVRVHTDGKSDELNQAIQAKAFTTGEDIFFREGAYEPGSRGGQELLAHELTHVVQQKGEAVQKEEEIVVNATTNKKIQPTIITVEDKEIPGTKNEDMREFKAHLDTQNDYNYLAQIEYQLNNLEQQTKFDRQALAEVKKYMQQHEKPKDDERKISLTEMKTMAELLNTFKVKIDQYKVPDINIKKNKKENQKKIEAFNNMLEELFNKELYTQSFSVTINVGDLDGLGDITAAIKLALELKQFFKKIEQWEEVKVSLHFYKLHQEGNEPERAKKLINNMLSETTINWNNGETQEEEEEKEKEKEKPKKVEFSYPAHNTTGNFQVSQYGYDQLNSERRQLGSGPGYGSLGVLPVSEEEKNEAIEAIEAIDSIENKNSNDPILEKINNIMHKYEINALHFGYFSKYPKAVKEYVKQVYEYHEPEEDKVIGIAISKSAINLNKIAESLGQKKKRVKVLTINEDGKESENEQSKNDSNNKNDKKSSNNKTNRKKSNRQKPRKNQRPVNEKETPIEEEKIDYVLINLCNGVPHRTMLSLYYMSDAPVGATGDQSFMEAYGMRRKKNKATEAEADEKEKGQEEKENNKATTDILYDVPEQQKGLKRQLEEIKNNELTLGNEAQKGLTPIVVTEKVENEINKKHLLYTIIMLINESLQSE